MFLAHTAGFAIVCTFIGSFVFKRVSFCGNGFAVFYNLTAYRTEQILKLTFLRAGSVNTAGENGLVRGSVGDVGLVRICAMLARIHRVSYSSTGWINNFFLVFVIYAFNGNSIRDVEIAITYGNRFLSVFGRVAGKGNR